MKMRKYYHLAISQKIEVENNFTAKVPHHVKMARALKIKKLFETIVYIYRDNNVWLSEYKLNKCLVK